MKTHLLIFSVIVAVFTAVQQSPAQDSIRYMTSVDLSGNDTVPKVSYINITTNAFHRNNDKGMYASIGTNSHMGGMAALGYTFGSWYSIVVHMTWDDEWTHPSHKKYGLGFVAIIPSTSSRWSPYAEVLFGMDFRKDVPFPGMEVDPRESLTNSFTLIGIGMRYYFGSMVFCNLGYTHTMTDASGYDYHYDSRSGTSSATFKREPSTFGGVTFGLGITGL